VKSFIPLAALMTQEVSFADGSNDTHKRSKSILKNKSDARLASDPESERLLSDTGSGVSDISVIPVSLTKIFLNIIKDSLVFTGRRKFRFLAK
jgi:hypothetical protein